MEKAAVKIGALATALLALAAAGCTTTRWVEFGATDDPEAGSRVFYYNPAALERRGHVVSGRQLITFETSHNATLSTFDVDCRLRRVQFRGTTVERSGQVLSRDRSPGGWSQIVSGSVSDALANRLCAARSSD